MKYSMAVILMALTLTIGAQNTTGNTHFSDGVKFRKSNTKSHGFLNETWVLGFVVNLNGSLSEEKLLNYNIHAHQLTFKDSQDNILVINTELYSGFMLASKTEKDNILFKKIKGTSFLKAKKIDKFYQLVSPTTNNVILESIKTLDDPNASGWSSSSTTTKMASYKLRTNYYVLDKNGFYLKVNLSKTSVLKTLKPYKKEISAYISSNNIQCNEPNDLVRILNFYHNLNR